MNISISFRTSGEYTFATIATDSPLISEIRASVRPSKSGGVYVDAGHSRKGGNDKYYSQLKITPEFQSVLDQVANMFLGKAEIVELSYTKAGFKITDVLEKKTGNLINAGDFAHIANTDKPNLTSAVIENPEVIAGNVDEAFN